MPITKERLKAVVDESFLLCARYRQIILNTLAHLKGENAADVARVYLETLMAEDHLPKPHIADIERHLLKRAWGMNEWRKNRRAEERAEEREIKRFARTTHKYVDDILAAEQLILADTQTATFLPPDLVARIASTVATTVPPTPNTTGFDGTPSLTKAEWAKIAKPDGPEDLPVFDPDAK